MHDSPTIPPHDHLLSLLAHWEHEKEKGNILTPEILCKDHPELLVEVREKLKQLKQSPLNTVDCEAPTIAPSRGSDTEPNITTSTNALPNIPGFHIESELGRGGMGVVYLARQIRLNRPVALKMIISGEHASADTRLRFLAEAEAIAKLHHPGIVQVHEFGTHDNNPFFALEYVPGGSLDKKLAGTPLPPKEAAALVEKLAHAVQAAHDQGIIHRDLKPANILLSSALPSAKVPGSPLPSAGEGSGVRGLQSVKGLQPKITDFGLVKKAGSDMTATGQILGTPSYMAPEQADGKKAIGPAVDIYALGAILYECLTGRPPFKAATPLDTILQVVNDEPVSIRQLQAKTPMDLETICHKCLQKDAGKRYSTAAKLAEDLGSYLRGETILARPVGRTEKVWRWCKRHPTVASLAAGMVVVLSIAAVVSSCLALWALDERSQANSEKTNAFKASAIADAEKRKAQIERDLAQRLLGMSRVERGLKDWQDGDLHSAKLWFADQAIVDSENKAVQQVVRDRLSNHQRNTQLPVLEQIICDDDQIKKAHFSPDGKGVVFSSKQSCIWDIDTGKPKTLIADPYRLYRRDLQFNSDGKRVLASTTGLAMWHDSLTGKQVGNRMQYGSNTFTQELSHDCRYLMIADTGNNVHILDTSTAKPITSVIKHNRSLRHARFSLDGKRIVTVCSDDTIHVWDTFSSRLICSPREESNTKKSNYSINSVVFSPDGSLILEAGRDQSARVWDATTGSAIGPPMRHEESVSCAIFSPDGRRIVTGSWDHTARIWNASTGQPIGKAVQHKQVVTALAISMDGRLLLTASDDATARLWNMSTGEPLSPPLVHHGRVQYVCFANDGHRFLTCSGDYEQPGEVRIYDMIPNSFRSEKYLECLSHVVSFSPDGKNLVTGNRRPSNSSDMQVYDARSFQPLSSLLKAPFWINSIMYSQDSKRIVTTHGLYATEPNKPSDVMQWNAATGVSIGRPLSHNAHAIFASYSPSGDMILTASIDGTARIWDVDNGKLIAAYETKSRDLRLALFSNDSKRIATVCGKQSSKDKFLTADHAVGTVKPSVGVQLWDVASGQRVGVLMGENDGIGSCYAAFSPDGSKIVICSKNQTAIVCDATTGAPVTPPLKHQHEVVYAAFSPDSQLIVTASGDKSARIWKVATGNPITPPLMHHEFVTMALFSKDGRLIATASNDKTARVWDASSGQPICPPLVHSDSVKNVAFSHDQRSLMTSTIEGVKNWEIHSDDRPSADLHRLVQVQSGFKIDQMGGKQRLDPETELLPWFQELKAKYPADFSVTPEQARRWRLQQITDCCKEQNLPAALFHQNWLLAEAVQEAARIKGK